MMYALTKAVAGRTVEVKLFKTKKKAMEGLKDAVVEFFSELGVTVEISGELSEDSFRPNSSNCYQALKRAVIEKKLPDVSFYGTFPFIDDIGPDFFEIGYETKDDWDYTVVGDMPILAWTIVQC